MKSVRGVVALVLTAAVFPAASSAATPVDDGATRWWQFSGGSLTEKNGLPVSQYGSPTAVQPAGIANDPGGAAWFNGSVDASIASQPTAGGSYSWEAWIKPAAGGYQRYVVSTGSNTTGYHLYMAADNRVGFSMGSGSTQVSVSSAPISIGLWHHVVAAISPGQLRLVVDGVESTRAMGAMAPGTGTVRISRWAGSSSRRWYGALDELAFYPLSVTTAKARERFAAGVGGPPRAWLASSPAVTGDTVTAAVGADDYTQASCRIDGGEWVSCPTGAWSASGIADGDHMIQVRATDRWGRTQETPAWASFRVDASPPETLLLAATAPGMVSARAFSEPGARIDCRVDGGSWQACPGGELPVQSLAAGSHEISARATDQTGNVDTSPPVLRITVDRSEVFSPDLVPAVQARASRGRAVNCRIGDGQWASCAGFAAVPGSFGSAFGASTAATTGELIIQPPASPLSLGALQIENFVPVGRATRVSRGPQTRPILRLILSRSENVSFAITRLGESKPVASWQWKLPAGGTGRELPAGVPQKLGRGRFALTANTPAGEAASVLFHGSTLSGGRRGRLGGETMRGSAGADLLRADGGSDRIYTGSGNDVVYGGTGPDRIYTGSGDDSIDGGSGDDLVRGGTGNDLATGGYGLDRFYGEDGNDSLDGGNARDSIYGGAGNDVLHGGSGTDRIEGGTGDDYIFPDSSSDIISAGEGDDVVFGNTGSGGGEIDCGPGQDTVFINRVGKDANGKSLPGGYGSRRMLEDGSIKGCERVIWADPLPVDPLAGEKFIAPDEGATQTGTAKNDKLLGVHGSDKFFGEGGDDIVWADQLSDPGGFDSVDYLHGGPGDDTIYGGYGTTFSFGDAGNDFIQGGIGKRNVIKAGAGNDVIRLRGDNQGTAFVSGGAGNDSIIASTSGKSVIRCGSGRDRVRAGTADTVARDCERVSRKPR